MIKFNKIILPFCNNWAERSGYNWNFYFNGTPEFKYFVSKYDYSVLYKLKGSYNSYLFSDYGIFINEYENKYLKLYLDTYEIVDLNREDLKIFEGINFSIYKEGELFSFSSFDGKSEYKYSWKDNNYGKIFIGYGILEYFNNEKSNTWLRLLNPLTGHELWKTTYEWQILDVKEYDGVITLTYKDYSPLRSDEGYEGQRDWHNPIIYNIAIDAETGKELWRLHRPMWGIHYSIDKERSAYLCMQVTQYNQQYGRIEKASVLELDLKTGSTITSLDVQPVDAMGFLPKFGDDEGIFYRNHYGSFGKIRRKDGTVLWEFDLVDEQGAKRIALDWVKLGNGKLVITTPPNHKNGDLTCIFDVEENMSEASVVNGVRVKEIIKAGRV
jgi:outer membrane protein assembly factor BamB